MKLLWICNTPLAEISKRFGENNQNEGWLTGIADVLRHKEGIQLFILFPQKKTQRTKIINQDGISFIGFFDDCTSYQQLSVKRKKSISRIINRVQPDVIHIFGTELAHSYECMDLTKDKSNVIISIQGLAHKCAEHYLDGIGWKDCLAGEIDGTKVRNLLYEKKAFQRRGDYEKVTIKMAKHIIGRTEWDYACVNSINPNCTYHYCNEILRKGFYDSIWMLKNVQRYSIFISQGNYPIKGLHQFLPLLPEIKKKYSSTKVYIAGDKSFLENGTPYGKLISKLINKYGICNDIVFTGKLTETQMINQFLRSHLLLVPSTIENSSNTIGEALLLGVPIVASYTGGIPSIVEHGRSGLLYSPNELNMMAHSICEIFENDNLALQLSAYGREKARESYSREKNIELLMNIYRLE